MATTWSNPKAPPPADGSVRAALASCTTGSEAATAGATDGLDLKGLTAVAVFLEIASKAIGSILIQKMVPGDTVTINGTVFTAKAPEAGVPGAAEFTVGATLGPDSGDDLTTAANLAAAINANVVVNGTLSAFVASDSATVFVQALADGAAGNALTLARSARATLSGATLAGGQDAGVIGAGGNLQAYLLNPVSLRWVRAQDFDVPLVAGGASQGLPPIALRGAQGRMQLVPDSVGVACKVYMNGLAGRIP